MKCDGRALDANGMSPLGIEYKRLYEKLGLRTCLKSRRDGVK
jgi:hypothetical protein